MELFLGTGNTVALKGMLDHNKTYTLCKIDVWRTICFFPLLNWPTWSGVISLLIVMFDISRVSRSLGLIRGVSYDVTGKRQSSVVCSVSVWWQCKTSEPSLRTSALTWNFTKVFDLYYNSQYNINSNILKSTCVEDFSSILARTISFAQNKMTVWFWLCKNIDNHVCTLIHFPLSLVILRESTNCYNQEEYKVTEIPYRVS